MVLLLERNGTTLEGTTLEVCSLENVSRNQHRSHEVTYTNTMVDIIKRNVSSYEIDDAILHHCPNSESTLSKVVKMVIASSKA